MLPPGCSPVLQPRETFFDRVFVLESVKSASLANTSATKTQRHEDHNTTRSIPRWPHFDFLCAFVANSLVAALLRCEFPVHLDREGRCS